ncbi:winged helix-turn-helix transcriptional regulator [Candidatus Woesearchaeota archaeon]|nr:winged helix-turn-helix transcriptional regulator [Candidatus Woesearchaeota archaeon]
MELESLFSSTRWEILKLLSKQGLSPIELAGLIKTTSANVSQQLRLLELAGLVKSEKTKNIEKGKPRIIYSLAGDLSYLILASRNHADKKLLNLSVYHKFMLKSWFLDNPEYHEILGRFFWKIQPYLDEIRAIAVNQSKKELEIIIVSENPKQVQNISVEEKKVRLAVMTLKEFDNSSYAKYDLLDLYDPDLILEGKKR